MSMQVKICGLNDAASVAAVAQSSARYAGFVFFPKSPRVIEAAQAASLIALLPATVIPVGLFVDASDDEMAQRLTVAPLRMIQLHGSESPQRVAAIRQKFALPVIKAFGIATMQDMIAAQQYESVADMLLLDARPSPDAMLPGGNAQVFDWNIVKQAPLTRPWMLAGGLTAENIAQAVAASGARMLDVSSGVEDAPGRKSPQKIKAFLQAAEGIQI